MLPYLSGVRCRPVPDPDCRICFIIDCTLGPPGLVDGRAIVCRVPACGRAPGEARGDGGGGGGPRPPGGGPLAALRLVGGEPRCPEAADGAGIDRELFVAALSESVRIERSCDHHAGRLSQRRLVIIRQTRTEPFGVRRPSDASSPTRAMNLHTITKR